MRGSSTSKHSSPRPRAPDALKPILYRIPNADFTCVVLPVVPRPVASYQGGFLIDWGAVPFIWGGYTTPSLRELPDARATLATALYVTWPAAVAVPCSRSGSGICGLCAVGRRRLSLAVWGDLGPPWL